MQISEETVTEKRPSFERLWRVVTGTCSKPQNLKLGDGWSGWLSEQFNGEWNAKSVALIKASSDSLDSVFRTVKHSCCVSRQSTLKNHDGLTNNQTMVNKTERASTGF